MRSLLDKDFHYVSSHETRITDTFDRLCPGWRPKKAAPQDDSESVASSKVAQGATPAVAAPFKKAAPPELPAVTSASRQPTGESTSSETATGTIPKLGEEIALRAIRDSAKQPTASAPIPIKRAMKP